LGRYCRSSPLVFSHVPRGLGLGKRLVEECERFARHAGYRKIVLRTHASLLAARAIYRTAGYTLVNSEPHNGFGQALVGETWELALAQLASDNYLEHLTDKCAIACKQK